VKSRPGKGSERVWPPPWCGGGPGRGNAPDYGPDTCTASPHDVTLLNLERAGRFLYLQRLAYGGKVTGQNFGIDKVGGARFDVTCRAGSAGG
jgi:hypothetical protein